MRPIHSLRHAWATRLLGAVLFAFAAAALANAADPGGSREAPARRGSAPIVTPSVRVVPTGIERQATFDGTTIVVAAGPWTPHAVHTMLVENGLDSTLGDGLIVRVQSAFPPTRVTTEPGATPRSTIWLDAWPRSDFAAKPDRTVAHMVGRLWIARYLDGERGFWDDYLRLRGLRDDPRLDTSTEWDPVTILADDYRLLFGSELAVAQHPAHMNGALDDPRNVEGMRELLARHLP